MTFHFREKNIAISFGKLFLLLIVVCVIVGVALFARRVTGYYRAIKTGQVNPLVEQRLDASFSRLVANAHVTADDLKRLDATGAPSMGPAHAKLTIVEFLDFDCPYCEQVFPTAREIMSAYQDRVRFVMRNFPIEELHPRAPMLAEAALCAHEQGAYWAFHDKLYTEPDHHEDADLARFAEASGMSVAAFQSCLQSHQKTSVVKADLADGLRAGVQGTPTFFFNGIKVQGAMDRETMEFLIKRFLSQ